MHAARKFEDDGSILDERLTAAIAVAEPARLREAMFIAAVGGGSRVRPRFCLEVARAAGHGREPCALAWASATAIEMIHCASLVHDDLPCFDDASLRRGQPTVHKAFGVPTALLAGDALIVAAFDVLAAADAPSRFVAMLARATGARGGLVSGQAMEVEGAAVDVRRYHAAKTSALFLAAAQMAADAAGAAREPYVLLAHELGTFYQLADDLADAFGSAQTLGKPVGRDAALTRPSAASGLGRREATSTLKWAAEEVRAAVPPNARALRAFVDELVSNVIARALG